MHRCFPLAAPVVALLALPAFGQADPPEDDDLVRWSDLLGTGIRFDLYGFVRADAQYADSRFNDVQIPGFVQSEDPSAPASVGAEDDDSDFALHARLTRFGVNFSGPEIDGLGNPEATANVEIDFYNIGLTGESDSRSAIRMRKAFVHLDWGHWALLAGQTWDVISPLFPAVNHDLVMWGAGNLGDRRPQLNVEYESAMGAGKLSAVAGLGLSGAVAGTTVEGGLRSGENSGAPMVHARIGYSGKTDAGGAYQLGVWGHVSEEDYDAIPGDADTSDQSYDSSSIGIDVRVPVVSNRVWLLGEYWMGENLDDVRGGIFQGVNPVSGAEIESEGGWIEVGAQATDHMSLHAGFAYDDPEDDDLFTNARSKNEVAYVAARWRYDALMFGLEYLSWETEYVDLEEGDANRVQAFLAYYF